MRTKNNQSQNQKIPIKLWMIQNQKLPNNRKNDVLIKILALKKDITNYLQEGYNLKSIWQYLVETQQLKCCYNSFRVHVNEYIKKTNNAKNSISNNQPKKKNEPKTDNKSQQLAENNSSSIKRFVHNSVPPPLEDLIAGKF